jgi:hypothetical protein
VWYDVDLVVRYHRNVVHPCFVVDKFDQQTKHPVLSTIDSSGAIVNRSCSLFACNRGTKKPLDALKNSIQRLFCVSVRDTTFQYFPWL